MVQDFLSSLAWNLETATSVTQLFLVPIALDNERSTWHHRQEDLRLHLGKLWPIPDRKAKRGVTMILSVPVSRRCDVFVDVS